MVSISIAVGFNSDLDLIVTIISVEMKKLSVAFYGSRLVVLN